MMGAWKLMPCISVSIVAMVIGAWPLYSRTPSTGVVTDKLTSRRRRTFWQGSGSDYQLLMILQMSLIIAAETRKATRTVGTTSPTIPMIPPMISPGVIIYLLPIAPTIQANPAAVQNPKIRTANRASRSRGKTPRSR